MQQPEIPPVSAATHAALEMRLSRRVQLTWWALLFYVLLVVYLPSMKGPFVYDDVPSIPLNEDFQQAGGWWRVFRTHETSLMFDKRPVGGLLTWLNYQFAGTNALGYRVVNLLIHWITAGLAMLLIQRMARHFGWKTPVLLSMACATLWALHPLNSIGVCYIYQRMETLMSLFFLAAMLCWWRVLTGEHSGPRSLRRWQTGALVCAWLSLLSKEPGAAVLPCMMVMDALVLRNGREGLRARWRWYAATAVGMALIIPWILGGLRTTELTAIDSLATPLAYFKAQCRIVAGYLRLLFWPEPLVFVPVPRFAKSAGEWVPFLVGHLLLLWAGIRTAKKHPWMWLVIGCAGLVLAASSSFIPLPLEPAVEFRMYLPSAVLLPVIVLLMLEGAKRLGVPEGWQTTALVLLISGASWGTWRRAHDYSSAEALWGSVAAAEPDNPKAWGALAGGALAEQKYAAAFEYASQIQRIGMEHQFPALEASGLEIMGICLLQSERAQQALELLERARPLPGCPPGVLVSIGKALCSLSRWEDARPLLEKSVHEQSSDGETWLALSECLLRAGQIENAVNTARKGVELSAKSAYAQSCLRRLTVSPQMQFLKEHMRPVENSAPQLPQPNGKK